MRGLRDRELGKHLLDRPDIIETEIDELHSEERLPGLCQRDQLAERVNLRAGRGVR
jgi:hypothetical protein